METVFHWIKETVAWDYRKRCVTGLRKQKHGIIEMVFHWIKETAAWDYRDGVSLV